jgi:uroporphyrin-III C-methyltransferase
MTAKPGTGRVLLVGAGPGDPDLLTVRAVRALEAADLVLYDALVDPKVLKHAPRAHCFYVGKRAGKPSVSQRTIEALMIRAARRGRVVVRLKAGDPYVLGRGGEEAIACEGAGIPVEVVPGVTSAIAGPASLGIPVTHRGLSPGFLVLSAVPEDRAMSILSSLAPGAVTVVLLMALGVRRSLVFPLRRAGWPAELPAAIVVGATTEREWSWTGTLDQLVDVEVPGDRGDLPGLVILGAVVSLVEAISRATWRRVAHVEPETENGGTCRWPRMQIP